MQSALGVLFLLNFVPTKPAHWLEQTCLQAAVVAAAAAVVAEAAESAGGRPKRAIIYLEKQRI